MPKYNDYLLGYLKLTKIENLSNYINSLEEYI